MTKFFLSRGECNLKTSRYVMFIGNKYWLNKIAVIFYQYDVNSQNFVPEKKNRFLMVLDNLKSN